MLYNPQVWLRDLDINIIEAEVFEGLRNVVMEENEEDNIEKISDEVFESIGEKRTLLNYVLRRKANWIGHILGRNCIFHGVIMVSYIKGGIQAEGI